MRSVLVLVVAVLAAGCTAAVEGSPSAGPPAAPTAASRPREVRLDGVDPCSLLNEADRLQLGLDGQPRYTNPPTPLFGGNVPTCTVTGLSNEPVALGVGVVTTVGIERWRQGDLAATVRDVDVAGFPSVVAAPTRTNNCCSVEVDVAAGQLLDVQLSDGGGQPPIPQVELCARAERAAALMMRSLLKR